ncbi:MAG TPA: sterol desaturase family protein [Candidatus Acidoferrales bacterium]|nr:sterol desaturase family protein [Candidatus Acidoferrales bacterium]
MAWRLAGYALAAIFTYYLGSLLQAALHAILGHRRIGGILYKIHVYHHHALYSKGRMVSDTYLPEEKDATPFYVIPVVLVGWGVYKLLPFDIFLVHAATISFCYFSHIYLHKQYHLTESWLVQFGWFRRRQQLHFVHHRRVSKNYALLDPFWDRIFGTYQEPDTNR